MAVGEVPVKASARSGVAITPSDTGTQYFDALYVGVTGNIKVDLPGSQTGSNVNSPAAESIGVTFQNVPVGFFPVAVARVYAAGTTASALIGLIW